LVWALGGTGLNVVSQEVVNIEAGTSDGWFLVEAGVRAMPVVEVSPGHQAGKTFGRVLIEASIGPFADGGLDEAFGLAGGARSVDASANVFELEFAAGLGETVGVEAQGPLSDMTRRVVTSRRAK
jgi:hypothetical protein